MLNNNGPKMDPCGTPVDICRLAQIDSCYTEHIVLCFLNSISIFSTRKKT